MPTQNGIEQMSDDELALLLLKAAGCIRQVKDPEPRNFLIGTVADIAFVMKVVNRYTDRPMLYSAVRRVLHAAVREDAT